MGSALPPVIDQQVPGPKAVEDISTISPANPNARVRGFVNMRNPNLTKLIQVGREHRVVDPNSPTGFKSWGREGDIKIKFTNGYWTGGRAEGDTERIAWCEAQAAEENCQVKDVEDAQAKVWAELVAGQTMTGRRDPTVSPSVDINSALRGEASLTQGGDDLDGVLRTLAESNAGMKPVPEPETEPVLPAGVSEQPQTQEATAGAPPSKE